MLFNGHSCVFCTLYTRRPIYCKWIIMKRLWSKIKKSQISNTGFQLKVQSWMKTYLNIFCKKKSTTTTLQQSVYRHLSFYFCGKLWTFVIDSILHWTAPWDTFTWLDWESEPTVLTFDCCSYLMFVITVINACNAFFLWSSKEQHLKKRAVWCLVSRQFILYSNTRTMNKLFNERLTAGSVLYLRLLLKPVLLGGEWNQNITWRLPFFFSIMICAKLNVNVYFTSSVFSSSAVKWSSQQQTKKWIRWSRSHFPSRHLTCYNRKHRRSN